MSKKTEDQLLVIFGASGDLTSRKLLPALFDMYKREMLPEHFAILGVSRTAFTDEEFRRVQQEHIGQDSGDSEITAFLSLLYYETIDTNDAADYEKLKTRIAELCKEQSIPDKVVYYLATPPVMYEKIPAFLSTDKMNKPQDETGWRRIVIEKPFGTNLSSAHALNNELLHIFKEKDIYRIDHYLGKETVQNILVLRFSNGIYEPLWNWNYIDSVEIRAYEEIGVENRGKYYDGAGALRDMIQNHLMELMAFTAMEPPAVIDPETMRDEIVKVFRSVRPMTAGDIDTHVMRAQYAGYKDEKNIAPDSTTETWVGMKFYIDNARWSDVPFYFYTGKCTSSKVSEITINFKSTPHVLFMGQCAGGSCNQLIIRIQPDEGISLRFGLKVPGAGFRVEQVSMDFRYSSLSDVSLPDAYVRLLMDVMTGDNTLYPRNDALEASWKFIDPIIDRWQQKGAEGLQSYKRGEDGPQEKYTLQF